jgi:hypothetical protein
LSNRKELREVNEPPKLGFQANRLDVSAHMSPFQDLDSFDFSMAVQKPNQHGYAIFHSAANSTQRTSPRIHSRNRSIRWSNARENISIEMFLERLVTAEITSFSVVNSMSSESEEVAGDPIGRIWCRAQSSEAQHRVFTSDNPQLSGVALPICNQWPLTPIQQTGGESKERCAECPIALHRRYSSAKPWNARD